MAAGLRSIGYSVIDSAATYFMCVDLRASGIEAGDEEFAACAVEEAGVAVVPLSAFADDDPPTHLVRLCFAKKDETVAKGLEALDRARKLFV
jgi:aspartate/methionine/tyrosine aminotransferase